MTESRQIHRTSSGAGSSVATGFLLGAIVGAGIALLLAPRTGKETREHLADAGRRWRDAARDLTSDLKEGAKSALDASREDLPAKEAAEGQTIGKGVM